MGQEKRMRTAEENGINMLYFYIIQRQKEGGKGGRARGNAQEAKINKSKSLV